MKKTCFIIAPIGDAGSPVRKRSDQLLRYVFRLVLEENGYTAARADEISSPGNITTQVLSHLIDDDLVIADLSGSNPNVFYELGSRHALSKPIIHVIEAGARIPFDIASFRTIFIDHQDLDSVDAARNQLDEAIKAIEAGDRDFHNPVAITQHQQSNRSYQVIPIQVYLKNNDPKTTEKISRAIALFSQALDLVITDDPPPETGSWWKQWMARTKDVLTQPELLSDFGRPKGLSNSNPLIYTKRAAIHFRQKQSRRYFLHLRTSTVLWYVLDRYL
jgi:hypothetical protein